MGDEHYVGVYGIRPGLLDLLQLILSRVDHSFNSTVMVQNLLDLSNALGDYNKGLHGLARDSHKVLTQNFAHDFFD